MKSLGDSLRSRALLAAVLLAVFACSNDEAEVAAPAPVDLRPPTPAEWDRQVARPDEAAAAQDRASCKFKRGSLPDETIGSVVPMGKDIPIETIVVLMQENRSFDHYFGRFGKYANRTDVDVPPEGAMNPDRSGPVSSGSHPWEHAGHYCFLDTGHSWTKTHKQIGEGRMDGFYETNHDAKSETMEDPTMALRDGERAMWWYDEREIPFYYELAKDFGLADKYFASLPGPTWPNRMYLISGTSFGLVENTFPNIDAYVYPDANNDAVIFDELDRRHVDFKFYTTGGPPGSSVVLAFQLGTRWGSQDRTGTVEDFKADAAAGRLPPVVFLDTNAIKNGEPDGDNEHPPGDLQVGQRAVADMVHALFKSPQWKSMALFITYDEHGGLYDHVVPPKACLPDEKTPIGEGNVPREGAFDQYGVRVPLIVVSPYAKKGYVGHGIYDHTSILRFIQAKHRLPALSNRDANAAIPMEFFDFGNPPSMTPPDIPDPVIDQGELTYCKQTFSK